MGNNEIKKVINESIFNNKYGTGQIIELVEKKDDYLVTIDFENYGTKFFKLKHILNSDQYNIHDELRDNLCSIFINLSKEDNELVNETEEVILAIKDSSDNFSAKENHHEVIEKNNRFDNLIKTFKKDNKICLQLINNYDNRDFEEELLKFTFIYLEKYNNYLPYTDENALAIIGFSLIALKYYSNNLYDNLYEIYKKYNSKNYLKNRVIEKFRMIVTPYLEKTKYYFSSDKRNSFISVPLLYCIVPHYRTFDLFKLAYSIYQIKLLYTEVIEEEIVREKIKRVFIKFKEQNVLGSENDDVKGTNYLMSTFTKSAIFTGIGLDELVEITLNCIQLIISYLSRSETLFNVPAFYEDGFQEWKKYFECNKLREDYIKNRGYSIPVLKLNKPFIELITAKCLFDEDFALNDIHISIYEDIENNPDPIDIYYLDRNDISYNNDENIGGYIINQQNLILDCNILNKMSYKIFVDDVVVYDSKQILYRDNIFFDGYGKEIKNGTEYNGDINVIHNHTLKDIYDVYEETNINGALLSIIHIKKGETYYIDNNVYVFHKIERPELTGNRVYWCKFNTLNNEIYDLFRSISVIISTKQDIKNIKFFLDGNEIYEDKVSYSEICHDFYGNYTYKCNFTNLSNGFHILQIDDGRKSLSYKYKFIVDDKMKKLFVEDSNNIITNKISSSFIDDTILNFNYGCGRKIIENVFVNNLGYGQLILFPTFITYSFDKINWYNVDTPITYINCKDFNKIYISGLNELVNVYLENNTNDDMICYKSEYDEDIYILSLNKLRNTIFRKLKIFFITKYNKKYINVFYYPLIKVDLNKDAKNFGYLLNVYQFHSDLEIMVEIKTKKREFLVKREYLKGSGTIFINDYAIDREDKNLVVKVYAMTGGIFDKHYENKSFYDITLDLDKDNITYKSIFFNKNTNTIVCQFSFINAVKSEIVLYSSLMNTICYKTILKNNEIVNIDLNNIYHDEFLLVVNFYDENNNLIQKYIHNETIFNNIKFINQQFKIKEYVTDTNYKFICYDNIQIIAPYINNNVFGYKCNLLLNDVIMKNIFLCFLYYDKKNYICSIRSLNNKKIHLPYNINVDKVVIEGKL